jgi:hypothetical protein
MHTAHLNQGGTDRLQDGTAAALRRYRIGSGMAVTTVTPAGFVTPGDPSRSTWPARRRREARGPPTPARPSGVVHAFNGGFELAPLALALRGANRAGTLVRPMGPIAIDRP